MNKKFFKVGLGAVAVFALFGAVSVFAADNVAMKYMTVPQLHENLDNSDYVVLDVRKAADFNAGHIKGAYSVDMDAAKSGDTGAGERAMKAATLGAEKDLVLICYSGKRYAQASTNALASIDYDMGKVFTLKGGMKAWKAAKYDVVPAEIAEAPAGPVAMQYISVADLKKNLDNPAYVVIDLRKAGDFDENHIRDAVSVDFEKATLGGLLSKPDFDYGVKAMKAATRDLDKNIVLICYSGKKFAQAGTNALAAIGYDMDKVFTLQGGMKAWAE